MSTVRCQGGNLGRGTLARCQDEFMTVLLAMFRKTHGILGIKQLVMYAKVPLTSLVFIFLKPGQGFSPPCLYLSGAVDLPCQVHFG